jgi:dTMP kinase
MLIAIVGADGAGKSTLARALVAALDARGMASSRLDKWDILERSAFPEARFIGVSQAEMPEYIWRMPTPARAMFIFWTIALSLSRHDLGTHERILVADGYWAKHSVVEELYGCDPDWIRRTVALFPQPDLTLLLDVEPELALARKRERLAYECGLDETSSAEAFLAHQAKVRARLLAAAERQNWRVLSATARPEDTLERTLSHVVVTWKHLTARRRSAAPTGPLGPGTPERQA